MPISSMPDDIVRVRRLLCTTDENPFLALLFNHHGIALFQAGQLVGAVDTCVDGLAGFEPDLNNLPTLAFLRECEGCDAGGCCENPRRLDRGFSFPISQCVE